nr:hypothetical protein [uncultured Desulfobacter sp.]
MKIILHAGENDAHRNRLKAIIEASFPDSETILTDQGPQLSEALGKPFHNVSVLIAFITDSDGVELLFSLKPLFENIKLILMLCGRVENIQNSVLLLEPLLTRYSEDDFQDIISVLQRIAQKGAHPIE